MKGMKPTKANAKFCIFRSTLLNNCKNSFEDFLNQPEKKSEKLDNETEDDRLDRELKTKHKLFGNIDFVGELYKESILSETILISIFEVLLGIEQESKQVNDLYVDAALKLINKLGALRE